MSDTLDFPDRLDYDGRTTLLAAAATYKQSALHQLRLAEAGDNAEQRLVTAQIHMLVALATLIENGIVQSENIDTKAAATGDGSLSVSRYSVTVQLFHNTNPAAKTRGYRPDSDYVVEVYTYYQRDVANTVGDREIVAGATEMFGAAARPARAPRDHRIANYLDRGNRALTMGDLIAVDGRCYALTDIGTTAVAFPMIAVTGHSLPSGTVPL